MKRKPKFMTTKRKRRLAVAMVQMRVVPGEKTGNLRRAGRLIRRAADDGARLVVLPEALPLGWTDPSARRLADEIPGGHSLAVLQETAEAAGVYVCSGLVERSGTGIYNSAVLIAPDGKLLLHHRKINELAIAHDLYGPGQRLEVAETPLGQIGLMICSDGFAEGQSLSRALGYLGADLILSPSSWAVPSDHNQKLDPYGTLWLDNYIPVARDFSLWIIGVSNVGWIRGGPWRGRKCIGCSLAINPKGEIAARGPYGVDAESIINLQVELVPRPARGDLWAGRSR